MKKILKQREANFQSLLSLPRFGEKYQTVKDQTVEKIKDDVKINIQTPAPTGISLPNGTRKKCLISGDFATYYDPSNGVPYNSVETFKVLKKLANGDYYWTQIDNGGVNSIFKGGVGCYFGEFDAKHAKGVPEGF
ncbi:hypothetical protein CANARDRAFT_194458 [[Candida] arabinofermentans NRRL YB-2248]|uniref:Vps72/YL1 C-terminal domain-containing protein n=1 Tax=[Candida] arabinofermentans NRRL YB-2248 TaxID=983967 RepID=A0A1E4T736_9ASCO|nr:hypothetical protein CANARDRAFT_194458 [[Candida] arabinofermentans NRRL YB-2248]